MMRRNTNQVLLPNLPLVLTILLLILVIVFNRHDSRADLLDTFDTLQEFSTGNPRPIYSPDPKNCWNRIFNLLFTRILKVRVSREFPEGAPFIGLTGPAIPHALPLDVSGRTYARFEDGDRAVDPFYPSFFSGGPLQIFKEPQYSELDHALTDALNESSERQPLARALMQSDIWAAYDLIYRAQQRFDTDEFLTRKQRLLKLLAQFIKTIALSRDEINGLPQNCVAAGRRHQLPEFLDPVSGWIEIEFVPERLHDDAVNFRREARVFVKPIATPSDTARFLQSLRDFTVSNTSKRAPDNLEAVALAIENLLIDSKGQIVASPLTQDVQIRKFVRDERGTLTKSDVREFELSRQKLLSDPSASGFSELDEHAAVFKPAAGNDYGFATPIPLGSDFPLRSPLLVKLPSRCADCHGIQQTHLMSFAIHEFMPGEINPTPKVMALDVHKDPHAQYVITRKLARDDFRRLRYDAEWGSRP